MKIWYQVAVDIDRDPRYNDYKVFLKKHLDRAARPGTEISVHGVDICSQTLALYRYEALLHNYQLVENLIRAQDTGYDAFCVGVGVDPAFEAIREIADIPVCSLGETNMLLACLLSPNFSILSHRKPLLRRVIELVKRYGLQDRFIECDCFQMAGDSPTAVLQRGFEDPQLLLEPAREVAREAAKKGVCMLLSVDGIFNIVMARHNIRQIEGIPLLDGVSALIKVAEMLVDLKNIGIDRSRLGVYTPIPKEVLASLRKLYGIA